MNFGRKSDLVMEAITAVAGGAEGSAESEFGLGVFGAVRAHYTGDGFALGDRRSLVADVHVINLE